MITELDIWIPEAARKKVQILSVIPTGEVLEDNVAVVECQVLITSKKKKTSGKHTRYYIAGDHFDSGYGYGFKTLQSLRSGYRGQKEYRKFSDHS
jgi:hypothetical protein